MSTTYTNSNTVPRNKNLTARLFASKSWTYLKKDYFANIYGKKNIKSHGPICIEDN